MSLTFISEFMFFKGLLSVEWRLHPGSRAVNAPPTITGLSLGR